MDKENVPHGKSSPTTTSGADATGAIAFRDMVEVSEHVNKLPVVQSSSEFREKNEKCRFSLKITYREDKRAQDKSATSRFRWKLGMLRSSRRSLKGCTFEAISLAGIPTHVPLNAFAAGAITSHEWASARCEKTTTTAENVSPFQMKNKKRIAKHPQEESAGEQEIHCPGINQVPSDESHVGSMWVQSSCDESLETHESPSYPRPAGIFDTDPVDDSDQRQEYQSSRLQSNMAVVAELVDDAAALAAQNEIDMLRQELEGIRRQHETQTATIVMAEPVQSPIVSSFPGIAFPSHGSEPRDGRSTQTKKLRISSLEIQGRDHELSVLHSCLDNTEQKQLVMISGYSGCGKTALASSLKPTIQELQGLYISGKFDLYQRDQPYFGINSACQDICNAIVSLKSSRSRKRSFEAIHDELSSALSPQDVQIIQMVVPRISEIIGVPAEEPPVLEEGQDAKNRLYFVFRIFFRTICRFFAPLLIVMDDLQWGDAASLELMQVLLKDTENTHFMMIGLYRSTEAIHKEEEDTGLESHNLTTVLHDLKEKAEDSDLAITEMEIGNLDLEAVELVVMEMLSINTSSAPVRELALACHTRTMGNVFFLISFLSVLDEEGLLKYDAQLSKYRWDIVRINSQTVATSNVVDLMKCRMSKLPKEIGHVLSIAACLGATFDPSILNAVSHEIARIAFPNGVEEHLSDAVGEGFIERLDNRKSYRWIHDQIQEAAFSLIPANEVSDFKFEIGQILHERIDLEEHVFQVANLMNEPPSTPLSSTQRVELAQLNLKAAKKAWSCSAFSSAARYASKGIDRLPDDHWKNHYKLSLELYTCAAESHEAIGKYEEMKLYCNQVLELDCPLLDKVPMYSVLATQLTNSLEHVKAQELLVETLDLLGCKYPKSTRGRRSANMAALVRFKMGIKFRTLAEARSMPRMECPKLLAIVKLNDKLITCAYLSGSDFAGLAILRSVKLTLQHGACPLSATAFAAAPLLLSGVLGDIKSGGKMGVYALELLKKENSQHWSSRTKYGAVYFGLSWVKPFNDVCSLLKEAYSEGLHSGDTESAMWARAMHILLCFLKGRSLKQIHDDCSTYTKQMLELKREQALDYTKLIWQMVQNLMGYSADRTKLQGNILPDFDLFHTSHMHNAVMVSLLHNQELRLHALFGKYEAGAELFTAYGYEVTEIAPGSPYLMDSVCSGGVCCFAVARSSTGKTRRKARKMAMKARATIKNWVQQGNPNIVHYEALMDAERDALMKRNASAEKNYHHAIVTATRLGFVQDAALAHERFSDFMMSCLSNRDGAAFHLKEAKKLYAEWGAAGKVEALEQEKNSLLFD